MTGAELPQTSYKEPVWETAWRTLTGAAQIGYKYGMQAVHSTWRVGAVGMAMETAMQPNIHDLLLNTARIGTVSLLFGVAAGALCIPVTAVRALSAGIGPTLSIDGKNWTRRQFNEAYKNHLTHSYGNGQDFLNQFHSVFYKNQPEGFTKELPQITYDLLHNDLAGTSPVNEGMFVKAIQLSEKMPYLLEKITPAMFAQWLTREVEAKSAYIFAPRHGSSAIEGNRDKLSNPFLDILKIMGTYQYPRADLLKDVPESILSQATGLMLEDRRKYTEPFSSTNDYSRLLKDIFKRYRHAAINLPDHRDNSLREGGNGGWYKASEDVDKQYSALHSARFEQAIALLGGPDDPQRKIQKIAHLVSGLT